MKTTLFIFSFFLWISAINFAQKTVRYDLYIADTTVTLGGEESHAIAVNGQIPMPTLTMEQYQFLDNE